MNLRASAILALAAFAGGFLMGRWGGRKASGPVLVVGGARNLPERTLGPVEAPRAVIAPAVKPGRPAPPPAPVPGAFGQQLSETATQLPAAPEGGTFHAAAFGKLEGPRLTLRLVEWMDTPSGRVELGPATTTEAPVTFAMPAPAPLPRWAASALVAPIDGHAAPGILVQHTRGPLVISGGLFWSVPTSRGLPFLGAGARW